MDDLSRLKAAQQQQRRDRSRDLLDRERLARETDGPGVLIGTDRATNQPIVEQSGGAKVLRLESNRGATVGTMGRTSTGFDTGNRRSTTIEPRRTATGDVKVFVVADTGSTLDYWLGGDRKTPIKILSVLKDREAVVGAYGEATGSGKDDWLFSIKTKILPAAEPPVYKIRTLKGDGSTIEGSGTKFAYLNYYGAGFWASSIIESLDFQYNLETTGSGSGTTLGSEYSGVIAGGIFGGSVSWIYPYTAYDGGATHYDRQTSTTYNLVPETILIFDFEHSGSGTSSETESADWLQIPGVVSGGQFLATNADCDDTGGEVIVQYGQKTDSLSTREMLTESGASYAVSFFDSFSEAKGSYNSTLDSMFDTTGTFNVGDNKRFPVACEAFDGSTNPTMPRKYHVYAGTSSGRPSSPGRTSTGREITTRSKTQPIFIAPGISKTKTFSYQKNKNLVTNQESITQTSVNYSPLIVFDKGASYIYVKTEDQSVLIEKTANEVQIQGISIDSNTVIFSRESATKLYRAEIPFNNDWKTKTTTTEITAFERTSTVYVEDSNKIKGKILPVPPAIIGVAADNLSILNLKYWPKN